MARPIKKRPSILKQKTIFDTDVLVWYFRGEVKALNLVKRYPKELRCVTAMSVMELLQGCRNKVEQATIAAFLAQNISYIIHPNAAISERAIELITTYSKSHGLRVIDAMVAASASLEQSILLSGNAKHFKFIKPLKFKAFKL